MENEITEVDFKERKVINTIKVEPDGDLPKFLRELAKACKKEKYTGCAFLFIDPEGDIAFEVLSKDNEQLALLALGTEDLKKYISQQIWPE